MAKKPTTFGLRPDKLAHILGICSDSGQAEDEITIDQQKAELLQDRLAETLLAGSQKHSTLRKELTLLCSMAGLASGEPIRNLLSNPKTEIELIKKVKEYGKRLTTDTSSEAEHETANIIYYAAIASALVFHEEKITQFSFNELEKTFSVFVNTEWISSDLIDLFKKTTAHCRKKAENNAKN